MAETEQRSDQEESSAARVEARGYQAEAEKLEFVQKLLIGMGSLGFVSLLVQVQRGEATVDILVPILGLVACAAAFVPWIRVLQLEPKVVSPGGFLAWHSKLCILAGGAFCVYAAAEANGLLAFASALFVIGGTGIWLGWRPVALLWYAAGLIAAGLAVLGIWESYQEASTIRHILGRLAGIALGSAFLVNVLFEVHAWSARVAEGRGTEAE